MQTIIAIKNNTSSIAQLSQATQQLSEQVQRDSVDLADLSLQQFELVERFKLK